MGKAEIISNRGEGFYNVKLLRETSKLETLVNELETKRGVVQSELDTVNYNISCVKDSLDTIQSDLNDAIKAGEDITELSKEFAKKSELFSFIKRVQDELSGRLLSIEKRKDLYNGELNRCNSLYALANCADYKTDLKPGDPVGTIEYGRQSAESMGPGWRPIIQPGVDGQISNFSSQYNSARDGAVAPAAESTPAGWLYNYIMEPGARKWRPLYRMATIRKVDHDKETCNVSLNYNQSRNTGRVDYPDIATGGWHLDGVPIDYMNCKYPPFTRGDSVVIEFRDEGPYVIGFENGPFPCENYFEITGGTTKYRWGNHNDKTFKLFRIFGYIDGELVDDQSVSSILSPYQYPLEDGDGFYIAEWGSSLDPPIQAETVGYSGGEPEQYVRFFELAGKGGIIEGERYGGKYKVLYDTAHWSSDREEQVRCFATILERPNV